MVVGHVATDGLWGGATLPPQGPLGAVHGAHVAVTPWQGGRLGRSVRQS